MVSENYTIVNVYMQYSAVAKDLKKAYMQWIQYPWYEETLILNNSYGCN